MDLWRLLADVVLLLAGSLLLGGIFSRLGQSPLVGYLIAGVVLGGPGSLHLVSSEQEIEAIAELGVALLLFSLGLEFSVQRLKKLGPKPLVGGVAQITLTIAVTILIAWIFGTGLKESIAVGAMVSLSSTAVVLRILMERGEIDMPHGKVSLGVLLTQDMAVVPLALLVSVLGSESSWGEVFRDVLTLIILAAGLILVLFVFCKLAVLALGTLTLHQNRELTMIFAVVTGLGSAWASHQVGLSPALGAFVAGMMLGSSAFTTQIRADIAPLQVILLTLFFSSAGMVANPIWILKFWYLVLAVVVLLTVMKFLIVCVIFKLLGNSLRISLATGLTLAQIGEFFCAGERGQVQWRRFRDDLFTDGLSSNRFIRC